LLITTDIFKDYCNSTIPASNSCLKSLTITTNSF